MKLIRIILVFTVIFQIAYAQIVINEASNKNWSQISAPDGEQYDWIELYNAGPTAVDLSGYYLSDNPAKLQKFKFPSILLPPAGFLLLYAADVPPLTSIDHWETAIYDTSLFRYHIPNGNLPGWYLPGYNVSSWSIGAGGFGYGDGDDKTIVPNGTVTVYIVDTFFVSDPSKLVSAKLHVDFDDGFVAYLNGTEIARQGLSGMPPAWNELASDHEAQMYQGYAPKEFGVDSTVLSSLLVQGVNTLAAEVHNTSAGSSDLTLRVFLSFGIKDASTFFGPPPPFVGGGSSALMLPFGIASTGETIYLSDPSGTIIDSLWVGDLPVDHSVGRQTNGGSNIGILFPATPGFSNNTAQFYSQIEPEPVFSLAPGFYNGSISVSITTSSPTAVIRYTTNGNTPDASSPVYTAPLAIDATTVVTARCFSTAGYLASAAVSHIYFINEQVTLPVFSITTDSLNLYGHNGIFDNWWHDWRIPAFIEYFDASKALKFRGSTSMRMDGGAGGSRSQPQKSFRLEPAHDVLGDSAINVPLIPHRPDRHRYEAIFLRNGSNQYLGLMYKDALMVRIFRHSLNDYQEYRPVIVFINGQYWGVYECREKIDRNYFEENYAADGDQLDLLSQSFWYGGTLRVLEGGDTDFYAQHAAILATNPTDSAYYNFANSFFDLADYADYIIAETYLANTDWPYNNIKIFRMRDKDKKWRFALQDVELGLQPNGWTNASFDAISFALNYDPGNRYINLWQHSMNNSQFRNYFVNRYADLMNTILLYDTVKSICDNMYSELYPELYRHYQRWTSNPNGYLNSFNGAHQEFLNSMKQRPKNVHKHLKNNLGLIDTVTIVLNVQPPGAGRILINTIKPAVYPWKGIYFRGVPVTVTAQANAGYLFTGWTPHPFISNSSLPTFTATVSAPSLFTANFKSTGPPQLVVSEVNYNSEPSVDAGDWIELWNAGPDSIDLFGWSVSDGQPGHVLTFPMLTYLAPNAYLVLVNDSSKFKQQHPGVPFYPTPIPFGLDGKSDSLVVLNPQDNVQFAFRYADTLPWPQGADGHGRTLELLDPNAPPGNPYSWFDGCIGGSPGKAYAPCTEPVVLTEINYNPSALLPVGDWVELYNRSNATINLSGWVLKDDKDSNTFVLPPATLLEAGSYLVLCESLGQFQSQFPQVSNAIGDFGFNYSGGGDWIRMYDASGRLVISVDYDDDWPWPLEADGQGFTLELLDLDGKMNDGSNWFAGCYGGSPGTVFIPCDTLTHVVPTVVSLPLYPNPASEYVLIQLESGGRLVVYSSMGRKIMDRTFPAGSHYVACREWPSGLYQLVYKTEGGAEARAKLSIMR